jgi:glycosyltransferase involved in cell wall biosynthesis
MKLTKPHVVVLGVEPISLLNFRKDLLKELIVTGHRVTAVANCPTKDQISALKELGVESRSIKFSRAGMNPLLDFRTIMKLLHMFRDIQPDFIIAYTAKPVIYGAFAARMAGGLKFCAMVTGLGYSFIPGQGLKKSIVHIIAKLLYRLALIRTSAIIFQNPDDLATFKHLRLLPSNANIGIVSGSGVDLTHFKKCPLPKKAVFLMIARLLVDKGIREYAKAAAQLRQKNPGVRTLLVGGLDPSPNSVSQKELDGWIMNGLEYLGQLDDVRPIIAQANVVVLPSYREGTPRSVLEGMAMGRAIITTDAPGCRETVQNGINGLLVPIQNSEALCRAMELLARDLAKVKKMGNASHQIAKDRYEGRAVARSVLQLVGAIR